MPDVLPTVDAGGTEPALLAKAMAPLLDPNRWAAAAAIATDRARMFEPAQFRAAVREAVCDLLPEAS
jgi:hypothetical protein